MKKNGEAEGNKFVLGCLAVIESKTGLGFGRVCVLARKQIKCDSQAGQSSFHISHSFLLASPRMDAEILMFSSPV